MLARGAGKRTGDPEVDAFANAATVLESAPAKWPVIIIIIIIIIVNLY